MYIIIYFVLFFMSVVAHEVAHGWAALKLGDTTAKDMGRLTFEPTCHIDPFMTIFLPLILFFSSRAIFGFPLIFGGAKPVPVNPLRFRNPDKGMAITAIAGPITNITIGIVFTLALILAVSVGIYKGPAVEVLGGLVMINFFLAMFNLFPIPPLDGSRIFRLFLPRTIRMNYDRLERFGIFLFFIIYFTILRQWVMPYFYDFLDWYFSVMIPSIPAA